MTPITALGSRYGIQGALGRSVKRASTSVSYIFREEFSADFSGDLTVVDTGSRFTITGGKLTSTAPSGYNKLGFYLTNAVTRAEGLALYAKFTYTAKKYMHPIFWRSAGGLPTAYNDITYGFQPNNASQIWFYNHASPEYIVGAKTYYVCIVLRATGAYYLMKSPDDTNYSEWTLLHLVDYTNSSLYAGSHSYNCPYDYDNFSVFQLEDSWETANGIATSYTANALANATATQEADALIIAKWQAVTDEVFEISVRQTDADNRWIIRISQAGTIKIIERNAGVETERATVNQTMVNGATYTYFVRSVGDSIYVRMFTTDMSIVYGSCIYNSASFNNDATTASINKNCSIFATYPRTLSGSVLSELSKYTD